MSMPIVTVSRNYQYEVAFSFLQEDEATVYLLNDLIQDRYQTFLYSQHQKDLVGKDGAETFRQVFAEKARIVVVLYREAWGTTFWTRVEETAIKHRSLEESADFTVFISLDGKKPAWLSKTQIWYDFGRFGLKPAAAIIEQRIKEYGGQQREETVLDQAARHKRHSLRLKEMQDYLASPDAVKDALQEVGCIISDISSKVQAILTEDNGFAFRTSQREKDFIIIFGKLGGLEIKWSRKYSNVIRESKLIIAIGDADFFNRGPNRIGQIILKKEYIFFENEARVKGWSELPKLSEFSTSTQLVEFWLKKFLEREHGGRVKEAYQRFL